MCSEHVYGAGQARCRNACVLCVCICTLPCECTKRVHCQGACALLGVHCASSCALPVRTDCADARRFACALCRLCAAVRARSACVTVLLCVGTVQCVLSRYCHEALLWVPVRSEHVYCACALLCARAVLCKALPCMSTVRVQCVHQGYVLFVRVACALCLCAAMHAL